MSTKTMTMIRYGSMALSILALIGLISAMLSYFCQYWDLDQTKRVLLAVTVLWFATAPIWMRDK